MDDIEQLLEHARRPGGESFKLDPARAREMMSRFQLENPFTYILKLVQWAVASGASRVEAEISGEKVCLFHDGDVPDVTSLEALIALSDRRGVAHLTAGLLAVLRLSPGAVVLSGTFGTRVLQQKSDFVVPDEDRALPNGVTLWDLQSAASWENVKLAARGRSTLGLSFVDGLRLLARPECSLLRFRGRYSPIPLFMNGHSVNFPLFGISCTTQTHAGKLDLRPFIAMPEAALVGFLLHDDIDSQGGLPVPVGGSFFTWGTTQQVTRGLDLTGPDFRGRPTSPDLLIHGRPCVWAKGMYLYQRPGGHGTTHNEVSWVLDGVVVDKEVRLRKLPSGLTLVLDAGGLQTDLSQFRLLQTKEKKQRLDEVMDLLARATIGTREEVIFASAQWRT